MTVVAKASKNPSTLRCTNHNNQQQCSEENVDAQPLMLWLVAADQGSHEESGGEPRGRDPEDAELYVPGSGDGVRQILRDIDAIEAVTFDAEVRGDDAHEHL